MKKVRLDAAGVYYRQLNEQIRELVRKGKKEFELVNVKGQRYIGNSLEGEITITIQGTPGQDLAAFMRGPRIVVEGNAQDGVGNTMDDGLVVINGLAGDVMGYAMRGGRIYVKSDVGYRVGIHMKSYLDKVPVIVIGGMAGEFLGEYMAGGALVLLGMNTTKPDAPITGRSLGAGMHGGVIFVRGRAPDHLLGPGLRSEELDDEDKAYLRRLLEDYAREMKQSLDEILAEPFTKIKPYTHRPYGNMYVGTN